MATQVEVKKTALRFEVQGLVQGIGFRPTVYVLATELGLGGWVCNAGHGGTIVVSGTLGNVQKFRDRLLDRLPPLARVDAMDVREWAVENTAPEFQIINSVQEGEIRAVLMPDLATCEACIDDIFDPNNRRYLYPFTNCTQCGPRYSIIDTMPYDRASTAMAGFTMCVDCQHEYDDPRDRRFHAQPNACAVCGPRLTLLDARQRVVGTTDTALALAAAYINDGLIVAVKGIGGFHLLADPRNPQTMHRLKQLKHRPHKPFALMVPSLTYACEHYVVSPVEAQQLRSPAAPIVLLRPKQLNGRVWDGVMLPYTPLHHILMTFFDAPLVVTSANLPSNPLCYREKEDFDELSQLASYALIHDRPILNPCDDSVLKVIADTAVTFRAGRGLAPMTLPGFRNPEPLLAVGGQQKNTVALARQQQVLVSPYIGDLDNSAVFSRFRQVINGFGRLCKEPTPSKIACDIHPQYSATQYAMSQSNDVHAVQHHFAHLHACAFEHQISEAYLGVSWDGTGYGLDKTVWGGEFVQVRENKAERLYSLRPFSLPGGEQAIREPRRVALSLLHAAYAENIPKVLKLNMRASCTEYEFSVLQQLLEKSYFSPMTSSVGRLFDGLSALLGLCQINSFEGQAAMLLEYAADNEEDQHMYPVFVQKAIDWRPMVRAAMDDLLAQVPVSRIARRIHNTLAQLIVQAARKASLQTVVLSGGCFQNKMLTELAVAGLRQQGFVPYWQQQIPPNDAGLSVGQLQAVYGASRIANQGGE